MDSCSLEPPESISVGPEFNRDTMTNVGILYANTQVILEETESILAFAKKHKFKFEAADQTLLLTYFKGRITKMPDEFNWKVRPWCTFGCELFGWYFWVGGVLLSMCIRDTVRKQAMSIHLLTWVFTPLQHTHTHTHTPNDAGILG